MKKFTVYWTTSPESHHEDFGNIMDAVDFARGKISEDIYREPRILHTDSWVRPDGTPAEKKIEEYFQS